MYIKMWKSKIFYVYWWVMIDMTIPIPSNMYNHDRNI